MSNRYDPRSNIPGYIPAAPAIEQGHQNGAPYSLEGIPLEQIRQEMMRRTGQYGPLPMHRMRGAIGGQNIALQVDSAASGIAVSRKGAWQTMLRDDHWQQDAVGALNASFKTIVTLGPPTVLFTGPAGDTGVPLGMIVRLRFGVGGTTNNQLIFDVPTNGMVHVPFCGETVIAEVALEQKMTDTGNGWVPDDPGLFTLNLVNSSLSRAPEVSGAIVPGQGLASSFVNNATRQIAYNLATGGDSGDVPIPRGTQAVKVLGPADLKVWQVIAHDSSMGQPNELDITPGEITPLYSTASAIHISSTADGGITALWFYLGI